MPMGFDSGTLTSLYPFTGSPAMLGLDNLSSSSSSATAAGAGLHPAGLSFVARAAAANMLLGGGAGVNHSGDTPHAADTLLSLASPSSTSSPSSSPASSPTAATAAVVKTSAMVKVCVLFWLCPHTHTMHCNQDDASHQCACRDSWLCFLFLVGFGVMVVVLMCVWVCVYVSIVCCRSIL
jgi:hypothetical protein